MGNNRSARKSEYQEYLRSAHWQETRKLALESAKFRCNRCPSRKRLQVHHKSYANLGHEPLSDLEVLCRGCHEYEHGINLSPRRAKKRKAEKKAEAKKIKKRAKHREHWGRILDQRARKAVRIEKAIENMKAARLNP